MDKAEPQGPIEAKPKRQINVVLFSGGSGTNNIARALLRHPQIRLRILINAYDDGHSTGRLRTFIPSMLGPSDVRKNISRLMPATERCHKNLSFLSDYRLPVGISRDDALQITGAFAAGGNGLPARLRSAFRQLSIEQHDGFRSMLQSFLDYYHAQEAAGRSFDFTDCAVGNLLFAGCFLQEGCDFNRSIQTFSAYYEVEPGALLNVTQGENLFLVAEKADGTMLLRESEIVAAQSSSKITGLYLLDDQIYWSEIANAPKPAEGWLPVVLRASRTPQLNPHAEKAIAEADVIVYGPGTQHSSLFPSYMTAGLGEAIAANRNAEKIFIGNIMRDLDIQEDDINDLAGKFMEAMTRKSAVSLGWRDCVTHFFVQGSEAGASEDPKYIRFDPSQFKYSVDTVRLRDWEAGEGHHSGGFVLDELRQVVQSRIDIQLNRMQHMVSIVVAVLDEARTLEQVLRSLVALDFEPLGLTKEIIVVDGGSSDASREIARSVQSVKVFESPAGAGRGAALRLGIEKARGSIIAFFPGDKEYKSEELHSLIAPLVQSSYRVVFGTRAVTVRDLSEQLKGIYEKEHGRYLTSKYGGILLSITTLLLYNRYISDVLTSVKVFDAQLLRSLELKCKGRDLEAEICAKLGVMREYILELPVDYQPRTHRQGKKITIRDGIKALEVLIRHRFSGWRAPAAIATGVHRETAGRL